MHVKNTAWNSYVAIDILNGRIKASGVVYFYKAASWKHSSVIETVQISVVIIIGLF